MNILGFISNLILRLQLGLMEYIDVGNGKYQFFVSEESPYSFGKSVFELNDRLASMLGSLIPIIELFGLIVFIALAAGGTIYITILGINLARAADAETRAVAKKRLTNTLVGCVALLMIGLLLNFGTPMMVDTIVSNEIMGANVGEGSVKIYERRIKGATYQSGKSGAAAYAFDPSTITAIGSIARLSESGIPIIDSDHPVGMVPVDENNDGKVERYECRSWFTWKNPNNGKTELYYVTWEQNTEFSNAYRAALGWPIVDNKGFVVGTAELAPPDRNDDPSFWEKLWEYWTFANPFKSIGNIWEDTKNIFSGTSGITSKTVSSNYSVYLSKQDMGYEKELVMNFPYKMGELNLKNISLGAGVAMPKDIWVTKATNESDVKTRLDAVNYTVTFINDMKDKIDGKLKELNGIEEKYEALKNTIRDYKDYINKILNDDLVSVPINTQTGLGTWEGISVTGEKNSSGTGYNSTLKLNVSVNGLASMMISKKSRIESEKGWAYSYMNRALNAYSKGEARNNLEVGTDRGGIISGLDGGARGAQANAEKLYEELNKLAEKVERQYSIIEAEYQKVLTDINNEIEIDGEGPIYNVGGTKTYYILKNPQGGNAEANRIYVDMVDVFAILIQQKVYNLVADIEDYANMAGSQPTVSQAEKNALHKNKVDANVIAEKITGDNGLLRVIARLYTESLNLRNAALGKNNIAQSDVEEPNNASYKNLQDIIKYVARTEEAANDPNKS